MEWCQTSAHPDGQRTDRWTGAQTDAQTPGHRFKVMYGIPNEHCPEGCIAIEHEVIAEPAKACSNEPVPKVPNQ